ncbi:hypothetical protein V5799_021569 [Amblyomma americanum]|uniref:Uncharacterized protein n=1 Tax=Amblyomma americanum TaxID=6943 RepID=A0AAQ4FNI5_AMBAM
MDRLPTIFDHKAINQLSPSFNTVAKRKKTSSKTASASPVPLLNELEIGCVFDVLQCDQRTHWKGGAKKEHLRTYGCTAQFLCRHYGGLIACGWRAAEGTKIIASTKHSCLLAIA